MKPKVIYSTKFLDTISFFIQIGGITIYPFIILRNEYEINKIKSLTKKKEAEIMLNHEKIHIHQQKELLVVLFYLWYFTEYFIRIFFKGRAYRNISLEREAYQNKDNLDYLANRKWYSFLKYI